MPDADIIIIGGGIAGLATAIRLAKEGKQPIVFEKYPVLGGRVLTFKKGDIQYEIGAGRIFHSHHRVTELVKRYRLHTYPIHSNSNFEHGPNTFSTLFAPLAKELQTLPSAVLGTHTIKELLPASLHPLLEMYPYRAEMEVLRADVALKAFKPAHPMGPNAEFYGIQEGETALIDHMAKEAKDAGAILKTRHDVKDITRISDSMFEVTGQYLKKPFTYRAPILILATCLPRFSVLHNAPLLKQLKTAALCRIYAIFPKGKDGHVWFKGMEKTVTRNPLRHVIPINEDQGLIMISYTDGRDTDAWKDLDGQKLETEIVRNARLLWPNKRIPTPAFLKKHMWDSGCTYWVPGNYNVKEASKAAQNPSPNLYIVGESVNPTQTWIESALESVESLFMNHLPTDPRLHSPY